MMALNVASANSYNRARDYSAASGRITFAEAEQRHHIFRRLEVEQMVYCAIVIRRHPAEQPAVTVRRQRGPATGRAAVDWLLRWETAAAQPDALQKLLVSRPAVSPHLRMSLTHRIHEGSWIAEACTLTTEYPFPRSVEFSADAMIFLGQCDGAPTTRDHLLRMKNAGAIPQQTRDAEFAELVCSLVSDGFLEIEEFRLPPVE